MNILNNARLTLLLRNGPGQGVELRRRKPASDATSQFIMRMLPNDKHLRHNKRSSGNP